MIKNLLLDMGGVILDVDYTKIVTEFETLGVDAKSIYTQASQMPFVDLFEEGRITAGQFRQEIRTLINKQLDDNVLDDVWNAMIGDLRKQTIQLLGELKMHYQKILLFSNTNEIHMDFVRKDFFAKVGFDIFTLLFDKAYLSNEIHYRKPNKEAFEYVLNDAGIKAEETLFIDDTEKNIQGAKSAGLNTYLLQAPETLIDLHNRRII